jgi:hypothetical protein
LAAESYIRGENKTDTHETVEAWLDNKWVIQDPTFNIHWELNGQPLGIRELHDAFAAGEHPVAVTDGFTLLPNRSLSDYYIPYRLLTAYVEIGDIDVLATGHYKLITSIPAGAPWNQLGTFGPFTQGPYRNTVTIWSTELHDALPPGWRVIQGAEVNLTPHVSGIVVETEIPSSKGRLIVPGETLEPGQYRLTIVGKVPRGGLAISVIDARTHVLLNQSLYSELQWRRDDPGTMYVDFKIRKSTPVETVLSTRKNNSTGSVWELERVALSTSQGKFFR